MVAHAAAAEGGSGSRMGAPQREALQISPTFIAENEDTIHSSSEEGTPRDEPSERRPARILFAFEPETDDEVAVAVGESVQVRLKLEHLVSFS